MNLANLPDHLIAHLANYLDYSDVCTLMETSKKNYNAIKAYKKDKIKLKCLDFADSKYEAVEQSYKECKFKNWNATNECSLNFERALQQCDSVDSICLRLPVFGRDFYEVFLNANAKIGILSIIADINITIDEMLTLGKKLRVDFWFNNCDQDMLSDEILTKLLHRSIISKSYGSHWIGSIACPLPITNLIPNALIYEKSQNVSISGVFNLITIEGIVGTLKIHLERLDNSTHPFQWDFGILRQNQTADAQRYFGENGELRGICDVFNNQQNGALLFHVIGLRFHIFFALADP